jgi:predicted alpha/beta-fold hydrolase
MLPADFPPFRPHPLLRSTHLQTIVAAYAVGRRPPYRAVRREVLMDDGDRIVLHDDRPETWRPGDRVVLMAHGLGGSYASGYIMRAAEKMNARGWRTFRKDLRGFGDGYRTARHACHAGRSEDIAASLAFVMEMCPDSPVTLVGFSMGANLALKYLGECEELTPANLDSAIVVAPPIDLVYCAKNLRRGLNRIYDWSFVSTLHHLVQRRRRAVPDLADLPLRSLPRRLFEFDHYYTAPLVGYGSAKEYYESTSAGPYMATIRLPTLVITAADDPVVPVCMFDRYERSSAVALHVTTHGGHLGYLGINGVDPDRRWLDWRLVDVIAAKEAERKRPEVNSLKPLPTLAAV